MAGAEWVLIITLFWNNTSGGISIEHIHGFGDSASCWNAGEKWADHVSYATASKYLRPRYVCIPLDSRNDPRPTVLRAPNPNVLDAEILTRINYGDK